MTTSHSVDRMGTWLHYWLSGPEDAALVALSHGATLDHHTFDAQVQPLVDAGYRVLAWDMRGHGASRPLGDKISVPVLADDLKAILDDAGVERAALVGHSFGGFVSQDFAYRHPDCVSAMVLVGCTSLAKKSNAVGRLLYRIFPSFLRRMSLEEFRRRTLQNLSLSEAVKAYAAGAMKDIPHEDFAAITMAGIGALWLDSGFEAGYTIPVPCLLMHGEQDRANGNVYARQAAQWAAREPNCQRVVIPDAGHTAHMDNPVVFNHVMLDFIYSTLQ